ncbi:MAG: hypothetical protein FD169_2397 [Bacillota bacterium]|nr:MAG: hypothetical protein FD169_2397 [Bacillota bacterium]MBS3951085.1 GNAT family N-acetyltransferase [Peptococcaceae bacterium]
MHISQARRADLPDIAAFFNTAAAGKRLFSPITDHELASILNRDPTYGCKGLFLARDAGEVIGVTHAFRDRTHGFIAYLLALCHDNTKSLLAAAEAYLHPATTIAVGSPDTPLYHTVEGRFQPLWGSTEMLEVSAGDHRLIELLRQNGYRSIETHASLVLDLQMFSPPTTALPFQGEYLRGDDCWYNAYSWYKQSSAQEFGQRNRALRVMLLRNNEIVKGHIAWYPMRDGLTSALCDLEVAIPFRGRGLGKHLLHASLLQMAVEGFSKVELHTYPEHSAVANELYKNTGFTLDATWYVFEKCTRVK